MSQDEVVPISSLIANIILVLTSNSETRYSVFRRVVNYYSDDPTGRKPVEDAFDMRKPLSRDKRRQYIRENGEDHLVDPEDLYHG